jgi:hypothetical protein
MIHIWSEGTGGYMFMDSFFGPIETTLLKALGVPKLGNGSYSQNRIEAWFLGSGDIDKSLSLLELICRELSSEKVDDINFRLRQNAIGYQFENGEIIKIDNQFVHAEVIKPALGLLSNDPIFGSADKEFKEAHRHYRAGENKQAVTLAGAAFESALKAICTLKKWPYERGARATDLIKVVNANGLFPDFLDKGFDSYIAAIKTGLPGVRNDAGPHGTAPTAPKVPDFIAAYALHLSAANIVLAIQAAKST